MAKAPAKRLKKKRIRLMKLTDRVRLLSAFGSRLRQLRLAKGITQPKFEALSGIDPGNLAKYEQGDREPGLAVIFIMAKALGVGHLELLDFDFKMNETRKEKNL
jgi:transcriptional regulator with XRE-family HTH domain